MRPIFRRCSARGAPARNTRTMVQPAIEHALGLMLGACFFLLVGFDHACPRFGSRLGSCLSPIRPARTWPTSCLSPNRTSTRIMPVPDSDLDSNHACPRFAQARAWPMSCLSPIRISTRIMPVPDSPGSSLAHVMPVPDSPRLELGPCHACPRFGSRLTDTRPTRPGAPPGQARRSSHRHSRRRSMSPIRPEAPRDRVRPALRLD